jgi:hypothetical protein
MMLPDKLFAPGLAGVISLVDQVADVVGNIA